MSDDNGAHSCIICGISANEKLSYFSFPKDDESRRKWKEVCSIPISTDVTSRRLCMKHFKSTDFSNDINTAKRLRLKKNSIPSIFESVESNNDTSRNDLDPLSVPNKTTRPSTIRSCILCAPAKALGQYFFSFPTDQNEKRIWASICNVNMLSENNQDTNLKRICDKHFREEDFSYYGEHTKRRRLKKHARPSLYLPLHNNSELASQASTSTLPIIKSNISPCANSMVHTEQLEQNENVDVENVVNSSITISHSTPLFTSTVLLDTNQCHDEHGYFKKSRIIKNPRYVGDLGTPHVATPRRTKKHLSIVEKHVENQNKKIASLQQKLRRANQKIDSLMDFIDYMQVRTMISSNHSCKI